MLHKLQSAAMKLVVAGPSKCGKSSIVDSLSQQKELGSDDHYIATVGCRIVEIELGDIEKGVELWDSSGNMDYSRCWPAIGADANGVILVCNSEMQKDEIELWHETYVAKHEKSKNECLVIVNSKEKAEVNFELPSCLEGCTVLKIQGSDSTKKLKDGVARFIRKMIT